ncbi:lipase family protein [Neolewinella sp.]|uniref:lipase family protein n=1 Tax=Neolewinella sp. TaxID=2993543 RepID=UPI003B52EF69
MKLPLFCLLLIWVAARPAAAQLQPGFDKQKYLDLMTVSAQVGDSAYRAALPVADGYSFRYRSPVVGLENLWDLYVREDGVAVISIRGTTERSESWLANFYAAMVPARGELTVSDEYTFSYQLAEDPRAAVHVGWLVSTAFLSRDMLPKIDSLYQAGITDVLIMGHSQGGGIAYLLTAYLYDLQRQGRLPADLRWKTYCSAGPKPGNLPFAYAYEAMTRGGWAFNVVNSADWVPEAPVTVQTLDDFTRPNPFATARATIKKQNFRNRLALNYAYNRLYKPTRRAQRNYQKILGVYTSRRVRNLLPGFVAPAYFVSNDYVRTGTTITLLADSTYYAWNTRDTNFIFAHHFHAPYIYLAERLPDELGYPPTAAMQTEKTVYGTNWELEYLSGPRIAFTGLFPDQRPRITFDPTTKLVQGNSGCNGYSAPYKLAGDTLTFGEPGPTTMMYCGEGEGFFLRTLRQIETYHVDENGNLLLLVDDVPMMRFVPID